MAVNLGDLLLDVVFNTKGAQQAAKAIKDVQKNVDDAIKKNDENAAAQARVWSRQRQALIQSTKQIDVLRKRLQTVGADPTFLANLATTQKSLNNTFGKKPLTDVDALSKAVQAASLQMDKLAQKVNKVEFGRASQNLQRGLQGRQASLMAQAGASGAPGATAGISAAFAKAQSAIGGATTVEELRAIEKQLNSEVAAVRGAITAHNKLEQQRKQSAAAADRQALAIEKQRTALNSARAATDQFAASNSRNVAAVNAARAAFTQYETALRSGALSSAQFRRVTNDFNESMNGLHMQTGRGTSAFRNFASAAVLMEGPLSGLGARVIAFNALLERSSLGLAALISGFTAAAVSAVVLGREMVRAGREVEKINNILLAATGDSNIAATEFNFVADTAVRLGLELQSAAKDYGQLAAAARGSAISADETRSIFEGVATASTALGLTAAQTSLALKAVQQMISKGKVQAEELRGQLGEQLPGAFNLSAKAMGVTTAELNAMLERGEVLAEDLLPNLARLLVETFGGAAEQAAFKFNASANRLSTAWTMLMASFNESVGVTDALAKLMNSVAEGLTTVSKNTDVLKNAFDLLINAGMATVFYGILKAAVGIAPALWKAGVAVAAFASARTVANLTAIGAALGPMSGVLLATAGIGALTALFQWWGRVRDAQNLTTSSLENYKNKYGSLLELIEQGEVLGQGRGSAVLSRIYKDQDEALKDLSNTMAALVAPMEQAEAAQKGLIEAYQITNDRAREGVMAILAKQYEEAVAEIDRLEERLRNINQQWDDLGTTATAVAGAIEGSMEQTKKNIEQFKEAIKGPIGQLHILQGYLDALEARDANKIAGFGKFAEEINVEKLREYIDTLGLPPAMNEAWHAAITQVTEGIKTQEKAIEDENTELEIMNRILLEAQQILAAQYVPMLERTTNAIHAMADAEYQLGVELKRNSEAREKVASANDFLDDLRAQAEAYATLDENIIKAYDQEQQIKDFVDRAVKAHKEAFNDKDLKVFRKNVEEFYRSRLKSEDDMAKKNEENNQRKARISEEEKARLERRKKEVEEFDELIKADLKAREALVKAEGERLVRINSIVEAAEEEAEIANLILQGRKDEALLLERFGRELLPEMEEEEKKRYLTAVKITKAIKDQEDALKEAQAEAKRLSENLSDDLVDTGRDFLDALFDDSRDFWQDFADLAKDTFLDIAAENLFRGPANAFAQGLFGVGGATGGANAGGIAGLAGSLGQSLGGSVLSEALGLPSVGQQLGQSLGLGSLMGGGGALTAGSANFATMAAMGDMAVAQSALAAGASGGLFGGGGILGLGAVGGPLALGALALGGTALLSGAFKKESVGPNAGARLVLDNGLFALGPTGSDNGGEQFLGQAESEALAAAEILNKIIRDLNRTVTDVPSEVELATAFGDAFNRGASDLVRDVINSGALGEFTQEELASILGGESPLVGAIRELQKSIQDFNLDSIARAVNTQLRADNSLIVEFERQERGRLNDEISALEDSIDAASDIIENFRDGLVSSINDLTTAIESINSGIDSLLLSSESPLSPTQRFEEARRQFSEAIASGDPTRATQAAGVFARENASFFGTATTQGSDTFMSIINQLRELEDSAVQELTEAQKMLEVQQAQFGSIQGIELVTKQQYEQALKEFEQSNQQLALVQTQLEAMDRTEEIARADYEAAMRREALMSVQSEILVRQQQAIDNITAELQKESPDAVYLKEQLGILNQLDTLQQDAYSSIISALDNGGNVQLAQKSILDRLEGITDAEMRRINEALRMESPDAFILRKQAEILGGIEAADQNVLSSLERLIAAIDRLTGIAEEEAAQTKQFQGDVIAAYWQIKEETGDGPTSGNNFFGHGSLEAAVSAYFAGRSFNGDSSSGMSSGGAFGAWAAELQAMRDARFMATGGIVTRPTFAMIGEGAHDEAVIPMPNGSVPVRLLGDDDMDEAQLELSAQMLVELNTLNARVGKLEQTTSLANRERRIGSMR